MQSGLLSVVHISCLNPRLAFGVAIWPKMRLEVVICNVSMVRFEMMLACVDDKENPIA